METNQMASHFSEVFSSGEIVNSLFLTSARRSPLAITGLIGLSVALYGAPAHAQQTEIDVLRQQLVELQARLDKLEAAKVDVKALTPTVNTASKTQLNISGLLQVQGLSGVGGEQLSLASNNKDSLRLRRGEIRLTVPKITDNISGTMQLDFAKTQAHGTSSSATAVGTERNSVLQEIALTWQAQKNAKYNTFVDIGQYKIPFGYESDLVSSPNVQTVERGLYYRSALGGNSSIRLAGDQRDQGVRVRGNFGEFDYNLGVFSGLGERQNTLDYDSKKAVAARLIYKPKSVAGLQVGASYATGGLNGTFSGVFATSPTGPIAVDRDLYNGFVVYKKNKLGLQGEYFKAKLNGSNGADIDAKSYYGLASYKLSPVLEGVLRYDEFDPSVTTANAITKEALVGLNYQIKGNNARVQANLVRVERTPATGDSALDPKSTELRVQFQLGF
jgi:phosphate-selective porin